MDFQKFKENILEIKKTIQFKETGGLEDNSNQFVVTKPDDFWKLANEDVNDKALKWKKAMEYKKKNGISLILYMRPMEGSKISLAQSRFTVEDCSVKMISNYISDHKNYSNNPMITKFDMIEQSATKMMFYMVMKMPLGVTNRDVVMNMDWYWQDDGSLLVLQSGCKHDKYPEQKGMIRIDTMKLSHFKNEGTSVVGQEFSNIDFKGYFPKKMINMVISATASKGIAEFAKMVKKMPRE